ncbi:MAG: hypothetical protein B6245_24275 [Desulfobacteraceae bacterium 4572_88]|nr:MAG: hypothetical protein B6245_24275 [Desulfobacteraceae bacterium 4572_88]
MVSETQGDEDAYQSRLSFEDIYMDKIKLSSVNLPDVLGTAFMGGPKPRINNWWYFRPAMIQEHRVRAGGREISLADFIGKEYWGRKFYFHQDPEKAVAEYKPPAWSVYTYPLETIPKDSVLKGRIYFESMPEPLLNLFLITLQPGANIRHKIGYGQAFGLGSIEISVENVKRFPSDGLSVLQRPDKYDFQPVVGKEVEHEMCKAYVDSEALKWLARILSYDEAFISKKECVFTYPPFTEPYFQTTVPWKEISAVTKVRGSRLKVSETEAKQIAEKLFALKKTIHFRVYQEKTDLWKAIAARAQILEDSKTS